jgi:hypothetical protein
VRYDGAAVRDSSSFASTIQGSLGGTMDASRIGYSRFRVGPIDRDQNCYLDEFNRACLISIDSEGVSFTGPDRNSNRFMNARLVVSDSGALQGIATLPRIDEPIPVTITLFD